MTADWKPAGAWRDVGDVRGGCGSLLQQPIERPVVAGRRRGVEVSSRDIVTLATSQDEAHDARGMPPDSAPVRAADVEICDVESTVDDDDESWGPHRTGWCDECGGGMDGCTPAHAAACSRYRELPPRTSPGESTEWSPVDDW